MSCAVTLVYFYVWLADIFSSEPVFAIRSVPGGSLLAGYGLLSALVIAIHFAARSMPQAEKHTRPAATFFLSRLAMLTLHASTGLFVYTAADMLVAHRFDFVRIAGAVFLSIVLAFSAAEAQLHTDEMPMAKLNHLRKLRDIKMAHETLERLPGLKPSMGHLIVQALVAMLLFPTMVSVVVWISTGKPSLFMATLVSSILATGAAFLTLKDHLHSVYRSEYGNIGIFSALKSLILLCVVLSVVTAAPTDVERWAGFVVAGILAVLAPFWILVIFCLPLPYSNVRGIVLHAVYWSQKRQLHRLERDPQPAKPKLNRLALLTLASFAPAPFGFLTALTARREIAASGERGKWIVYTVFVMTALILGAISVLLVVLPSLIANLTNL